MTSFEYDNMDMKFDAVLKTPAGKTIELGRGQFSAAEHSVDFEGEFVPLFSMGTQLEIVRIHDGTEVHRFTGEVYLSSAHMLRLVSVRDEILPGAALVFLYYVNLEGVGQTPVKAMRRGLFGRKHTVEEMVDFPVRIHALSVREIKFNTELSVELDPEQTLSLTFSTGPRIEQLPLVVRQAIVFGQEANCYRCRILGLSAANRLLLEDYVRGLSLATVRKSL